ncbi:hypothetical protein [Prevotella sp. KH2C16]|uniref:AlkZ-related protein n=1 Tax=Prevotella sp. KH2C16 TaxID=1855325 RepID=UPI0008E87B8B|nr:hypothetical protein [Prevotella sp. KH2C16]SFG15739.1 hypothetical protein SAMN05216383_10630 [Prevotella sp. KH2C16]
MKKQVHSPEELERLVEEMGFLPFFWNDIPGFSLGAYTAPEYWFPEEGNGVWDWKGPVIVEGGIAYGKFFENKAGFISMDWFPDFLNYRRSTYKLSTQEKRILDTLKEHQTLLSKDLKKLCGYTTPRTPRPRNPLERQMTAETRAVVKKPKSTREAFDTAITRLQMGTQVITADFEYNYDKQGKRYGWGVARYCTPEDFFGEEHFLNLERTPKQSARCIFDHLRQLLPHATKTQILKIIG